MKKKYLALVLAVCMQLVVPQQLIQALLQQQQKKQQTPLQQNPLKQQTLQQQPVSMDPAAKLLRHGRIMMQESLQSDRRQILQSVKR